MHATQRRRPRTTSTNANASRRQRPPTVVHTHFTAPGYIRYKSQSTKEKAFAADVGGRRLKAPLTSLTPKLLSPGTGLFRRAQDAIDYAKSVSARYERLLRAAHITNTEEPTTNQAHSATTDASTNKVSEEVC